MVRDYVREQNISSQVLLDKEGSVGQAYGADSIPMHILIDKNGITRYIQLGFSPRYGIRNSGPRSKSSASAKFPDSNIRRELETEIVSLLMFSRLRSGRAMRRMHSEAPCGENPFGKRIDEFRDGD